MELCSIKVLRSIDAPVGIMGENPEIQMYKKEALEKEKKREELSYANAQECTLNLRTCLVDARDETGSWLWNQLLMRDDILVKTEDDTLTREVF